MRLPRPGSDAWDAWHLLAARLAGIRASAGLTGAALNQLCGRSSTKVSRIERASTLPSADEIRAWCRHCGASGQTQGLLADLRSIQEMSAAHRAARRAGPGPAPVRQPVLPPWERTTIAGAYSSWIMPDAVQTEEYSRAVIRLLAGSPGVPDRTGGPADARAERLRLVQARRSPVPCRA